MSRKNTSPAPETPVQVVNEPAKVSKKVEFSLRQSNGNHVSFELSSTELGEYTQDQFAGTFLFPALVRLMKGTAKLFDRKLPIELVFSFEATEGTTTAKVIGNVKLANSSFNQVRKASLIFNEAIAGMVYPAKAMSVYTIADMRKDKGAALRALGQSYLRPSVSLTKALPELAN